MRGRCAKLGDRVQDGLRTALTVSLRSTRAWLASRSGATAFLFAVIAPSLVATVIFAVDISSASSERTAIQDGLDAAALAGAKLYNNPAATDQMVKDAVTPFIAAVAGRYPNVVTANVTPNAGDRSVTISYSGPATNLMTGPLLQGVVSVTAMSKAKLGGSVQYPVCILITEPTAAHTLRASNRAQVDLKHCLVQVNTNNWDAVEAERDGSYIHITDGQNCYVGDIHFGDILPAKAPTCDLFPDPFETLDPAVAGGCDYNNLNNAGGALRPGVYCGGLKITKDATLSPGIYTIKNGLLSITGAGTDVTGNGVVFVLSGNNAGFNINTTGRITLSPLADHSRLDSFLFFLDQSAATNSAAASTISNATFTASGYIYLRGQQLVTTGAATRVTINPGAIIADFLLPQGGTFNFTGSVNSASAMTKSVPSTSPIIVQ